MKVVIVTSRGVLDRVYCDDNENLVVVIHDESHGLTSASEPSDLSLLPSEVAQAVDPYLNSAHQLQRERSTGYPRVSLQEGFPLEFMFRADITDQEVRAFDDRLVLDILFGQHLLFGYGAYNPPQVSGFVTQEDEEDACTEEDREEITRRLAEYPELASFEVGPLSIRTFTVTVATQPKAGILR